MSFKDRVSAFRDRQNGDAIADHAKGPTMEPTNGTTETEDRGMPLLDLTDIDVAEVWDVESDATLTIEYVEEKFAAVMTREDIARAMRMRAEEAEAVIEGLAHALETAEAAARRAETAKILAENSPPEDLERAKLKEAEAILTLTTARNAHVHALRRAEVLRDQLGVDCSLKESIAGGISCLAQGERWRSALPGVPCGRGGE